MAAACGSGDLVTTLMANTYLVRGAVQGVGYRWFVARHASALSIRGFARNQPDGTVEVVAIGRALDLEQLEQALWRGPEFARVAGVEKAEVSLEVDHFKTFEIR